MKKLLLMLSMLLLVVLAIGCSDDDNDVTGQQATDFVEQTVYDSTLGLYVATLNAEDSTTFIYYSFDDAGIVSKVSAFVAAPADWDLAFKRQDIILNSGESGTGNVVGANLGAVNFDAVTIADTANVSEWLADGLKYQIDSAIWYNPVTHQIPTPGYIYAMFDAGGVNLLKFRLDSAFNASQGSYGEFSLTYFYQTTANSFDLPGPTLTGFMNSDSTYACFDFSGDSALYPADIAANSDWDICFTEGNMLINCAANGPGNAKVHAAYQSMAYPSEIDSLTSLDPTAIFFVDHSGSVATDWYDYDIGTHTLTSKGDVYLLHDGTNYYKLQLISYYGVIKGQKTSRLYTFHWDKL